MKIKPFLMNGYLLNNLYFCRSFNKNAVYGVWYEV